MTGETGRLGMRKRSRQGEGSEVHTAVDGYSVLDLNDVQRQQAAFCPALVTEFHYCCPCSSLAELETITSQAGLVAEVVLGDRTADVCERK